MAEKQELENKGKEEKIRKQRANNAKKAEPENKEFSLRGIKDLGKQKELLEQEIERLKKETKKMEDKLQKVNDKLKENDWKELTKHFSIEEIRERLQQQGN